MQLILELLKKIFVALQGVYTKQETDSALATKADATALEAEVQRVDTRLAEHDAEIDTLQKVTAGLGEGATAAANVAKWQTYATAIQKDLDAETAMQFAQEFSRATDEYLADPTATKDWSTIKDENGNVTSKNPYYATAPTAPVVDFNVTVSKGIGLTSASFAKATDVLIFMPNLSNGASAFCKSNISTPPFVPNLEYSTYGFRECASLSYWNTPLSKLTDGSSMFAFSGLKTFSVELSVLSTATEMFRSTKLTHWTSKIPKVNNGNWMFTNCTMLTYFFAEVSSLTSGTDMFKNTNLNKESVIRILNSLSNRSGKPTATISFMSNVATAAVNNIDAELQAAIDAARNKNWTVEV